ncbi:MAG: hypothetical protein M1819_005056 [Sarea resinae]|nr:MAG: hypothetical protein M1819_005056 [Sarea resinae]
MAGPAMGMGIDERDHYQEPRRGDSPDSSSGREPDDVQSQSPAKDEMNEGEHSMESELDPARTPRSEGPYGESSHEGYFESRFVPRNHRPDPASASTSTESSPLQSTNASTTSLNTTTFSPSVRSSLQIRPASTGPLERPGVFRDFSGSSTVSTSTVTAPGAHTRIASASASMHVGDSTGSHKQHQDGPVYPNQSFSVLQNQIYPPAYIPHNLRTRISHPSQHSFYLAGGSPFRPVPDVPIESGSKTVGNTPATSPGLFNPPVSPAKHVADQDDTNYRSPYLHWTQTQVPKETHVADVDRDPISGRKLINQYEIIDELGRGVHGKVKLGRNLTTGDDVAIKIVDRYSKRRRLGKLGNPEDKVKREVAILKKARHPNVVSLLEVIDDPAKKKVYIVLEYVALGEIIWRRKGVREIVTIERRRTERESRGVVDDISYAIQDERLLREAEIRRRRKERAQARARHMQKTGADYWSLEYGDSDEDDFPQSSSYRTQDSDGSPVEMRMLGSRHNSVATINTNLSRMSTPLPPDADSLAPLTIPEEDSSASHRPRVGASAQGAMSRSSSSVALEGTMYGAYSPEQVRTRTGSVADSLVSHVSSDLTYDPSDEDYAYVPCLTMQVARSTFRDTVLGLEYLHYQGIIHRDIKPANLLWTSKYRVKISDFGVSYLGKPIRDDDETENLSESDAKELDEAVELAKTVGTPAFYAPELCHTDFTAKRPPVTGQIDVWALGVTLYAILFARLPFTGDDEFLLYKSIAEDPVFIPRKRLKAVEVHPSSRTDPQAQFIDQTSSNNRTETELAYEDIDDDLYDLLKKLFQKDPTKRITLKEVKHHPWVIRDIPDPVAWLEQTDPSSGSHGKKIEVSNEEVADAVVPLNLIERMRSGMRKLGGALGIGKSKEGRRRAQSSAHSAERTPSSPASSTSAISIDGRRLSLRGDESIFSALKASREGEHPLAQSVTASPENPNDENPFFTGTVLDRQPTPVERPQRKGSFNARTKSTRPSPPERAASTAGSMRTIRASDECRLQALSQAPSPGLPGTPTVVEHSTTTNIGGIFGGAGRRLVKSMRSRERNRDAYETGGIRRIPSSDRVASGFEDPHAEPSVAFSKAFASGHVDTPPVLKEVSPNRPETEAEGALKRPSHLQNSHSVEIARETPAIGEPYAPSGTSSNRSSTAPAHERRGSMVCRPSGRPLIQAGDSNPTAIARAQEQLHRRRHLQNVINAERRHSVSPAESRSESPALPGNCPPSPDDEIFFQKHADEDSKRSSLTELDPLTPSEMMASNEFVRPVISSSSEDQFTSGMSQSTSDPSIPSVISAGSSISADDSAAIFEKPYRPRSRRTNETITPDQNPADIASDDEAGYNGDSDNRRFKGYREASHAIQSDDDSDSEGDYIVMSKRKDRMRAESVSNGELSRRALRSSSSMSRSKTRSGSSGTMKKVMSEDSDPRSGRSSRPLTPRDV